MKQFIRLTSNYKGREPHEDILLPVDEIVRVEQVDDIGSLIVCKDEFKKGKVFFYPVLQSLDEIEEKLSK